MLTFKQFLIREGGVATSAFNVSRANQSDIKAALEFVSKAIAIPFEELKDSLLGSTEITLMGLKDSSGDIDIAVPISKVNADELHSKMMAAVSNEGEFNKGTKVASYAVPVNGKKVQVDLMFVNNKEWAKFSYHSAQGRKENGSKYPGSVRKIVLTTAMSFVQEPGKDFIERDEAGNVIARATRVMKNDVGLVRVFKRAKINPKTGKPNKTLEIVSAEELKAFLKQIGKNIKFDDSSEVVDDPNKIAEFVFGPGIKASDIMTAEQVIKLIKTKMKNPEKVLAKCKSELERLDMPVPEELS